MKLTKNQTENLKAIWTSKVAYGVFSTERSHWARIGKTECAATGFVNMHSNASQSLVMKGLARPLTTLVDCGQGYRVQVLVLTDLGRAQLGV